MSRFTVNAFWRNRDGRDYSPGPVILTERDQALRLYRRMRDNPSLFVGDDCVLFIVGPVIEEEKIGRTWRYRGTPAAAFPAVDRADEAWRERRAAEQAAEVGAVQEEVPL